MFLADLESANSDLEGEVTRLEGEVASLEGEVTSLQTVVEELTAEIEELTAEPEAPDFNLEDLMGIWTNGSGSRLSGLNMQGVLVFEDDYTFTSFANDSHFFGDDPDGISSIWQLNDSGNIVIGGDIELTIEINGALLTVTDQNGNERMFQRYDGEMPEEDEDEDEDDEDEPEDDEDEPEDDEDEEDASNGASASSDVDWRQFLEDYDAFTTRRLRDPVGLLEESFEWLERVAEIQDTHEGADWQEFFEESLRIGMRTE